MKAASITKFGVEVEFTGMTRSAAAVVVASVLRPGLRPVHGPSGYDAWEIADVTGRVWSIVSDGSISCETTRGITVDRFYSCELVTPILTYAADMETLQNVVRALRKAGGRVNGTCGIHIHLDGADQTVRSLKNWISIVAAKNDLLYAALAVNSSRLHYCKKIDETLVIACKKATTLQALSSAWYATYSCYHSQHDHYHSSRYHFLNLHSFFAASHHTVELRGFNSTLHAGELRSYVVFALALNDQALSQKTARSAKAQTENQKFAMRTYLNRLGLIGEEYASCREHLTKKLTGCAAWRFGARP